MDQILPFFGSMGALSLLICGFCLLIFVHELGHFLAAKMVDMKVTQFALGIGPAIFSWRKGMGFRWGSTETEFQEKLNAYFAAREKNQIEFKEKTAADRKPSPAEVDQATRELGMGETEYRVNWVVPMGGYVKLLGQEDLKPDAVSDDARSFNRKPAWARAVVLSAGVVMNIIFGMLFFIVAFMAGVAFPPAVVGDTLPGGPAATTFATGHDKDPAFEGLQPGDRVLRVNDEPITDFTELAMLSALTGPGESLRLTIERDGLADPLTYNITPAPPEKDAKVRVFTLGVSQPLSLRVWKEAKAKDLPASLLNGGVKPGMSVREVDGRPVQRFDQLEKALASARGVPVQVTFADDAGQSVTLPLAATPEFDATESGVGHVMGVTPTTVVTTVLQNSPAQTAGMKTGDIIARIGERYWPRPDQVLEVVRSANGRALPIEVYRDGKLVALPDTAPAGDGRLGFMPNFAKTSNLVATVQPSSPLAPLKLTPGSRILAVNDQPVADYAGLVRLVTGALGDPAKPNPIKVSYRLNLAQGVEGEETITLSPDAAKELAAADWRYAESHAFEPLTVSLASADPLHAASLGFKKTHQFMLQTYITILRLVQQRVDVRELRGMVGIVNEGTRIAQMGGTYLLFFLGLLSINLAVMNFLPIPILDGGQMLFLLIEKLKGSPVSIRVQEVATYVGLAIIGSLFLVTLYFDTGRLLGL